MNLKALLQMVSQPWFIEEAAAYYWANVFHEILNGNASVTQGLLDSKEYPYRVNAQMQRSNNGEVLVLPVSGVMMRDDFCGSMGTASMISMIKQFNADSSFKSMVLSMRTPGGSVDGTEDFAYAVQNSAKPIVSHVSMMASAGYWAGSGSKEIILSGETSMAGSIGTMATLQDARALKEKNGVKEIVITASRSVHKNKAALDAIDGNPEAYRAEFLDPLNAVFEKAVTKNRTGKINIKNEDVLTGKIYLGSNAVQVGLADKIGSLDYAIKRSLQLAKTIQ